MSDLTYAVRQIANNRSVAAVLVLTIALGIGVNATVVSMVNGVAHPLPVNAPEQIVVLAAETKGDELGFAYRFSYPALEDLRRQADPFRDLFAFDVDVRGFGTGGKITQFFASDVTGNYFSALGVAPAVGRLFQPREGEARGSDLTVVLGYTFWQKRFGGDPAAVGRQVRIDGRAATVIGVAQKEFHGTFTGVDMDGYLPLRNLVDDGWAREMFSSRSVRPLTVMGRMKPGVSLEQVQAFMSLLALRMQQEHPATDQGVGIRVLPELLARPVPWPYLQEVAPLIRLFLLLLAGLVLALACMNVANILLVRATVRQREMAIRAALGSGRGRLIRQMLTESLLLAVLGAAAGMVLGKWTASAVAGALNGGSDWPILVDFSFDWRVFAYSLAAALFTALFIGIWPALRASQAQAGAALHDGGRSHSGGPQKQRIRGLLVVAQVAGSLVLLICAGLSVRSLQNAQRLDLGFAPDRLLNARMNPLWAGYDVQRTQDFYLELERRVRAWPEARSVSLAFSVPLGPVAAAGQTVFIEGRPAAPGQQPPFAGCNYVDPGYFETLRIPLLRGRAFLDSDSETAPRVAVVNRAMADRYWPNQNPIGKRFHATSQDTPWLEVVGVAGDSKYLTVIEPPLPYFYVPLAQNYQSMRVLQVRTSVAPESLSARLEQEIRTLDPTMPVNDLETMTRALSGLQGFLSFRIAAIQTGALGILGLVLALVGVYGVVSYGAAQRTREVGIRMALGATPQAILGIVLGQGVWMVLSGIVAGLLGAVGVSHVLGRFMMFVSLSDPVTFVAVPALLALVALWACYIPARRAMRADPMAALRHE